MHKCVPTVLCLGRVGESLEWFLYFLQCFGQRRQRHKLGQFLFTHAGDGALLLTWQMRTCTVSTAGALGQRLQTGFYQGRTWIWESCLCICTHFKLWHVCRGKLLIDKEKRNGRVQPKWKWSHYVLFIPLWNTKAVNWCIYIRSCVWFGNEWLCVNRFTEKRW